ncbi:hypothetical protein STIAU_2095 [Stigmatella aurantiaca DW4/3-1]|uniref:Uncharacterized protein n=1 Tax=Stigmatella aurantiaca (strain DW4/3-1) TaxID=378806 RepID=Q09CN3_STIAD|nr:hypothetical protein STIAU_2095 [Stigmatella aurantiaca DW4/3-1]
MARQHLGGHSRPRHLHLLRIGDHASDEEGARPGDFGELLGDEPAGAALRRGQGRSRLCQQPGEGLRVRLIVHPKQGVAQQLAASGLGRGERRIGRGLRGGRRHQLDVVLRRMGPEAEHHLGVQRREGSHPRVELGLGNPHRAQQPEGAVHAPRLCLQEGPDARQHLPLRQRPVLPWHPWHEEEAAASQPEDDHGGGARGVANHLGPLGNARHAQGAGREGNAPVPVARLEPLHHAGILHQRDTQGRGRALQGEVVRRGPQSSRDEHHIRTLGGFQEGMGDVRADVSHELHPFHLHPQLEKPGLEPRAVGVGDQPGDEFITGTQQLDAHGRSILAARPGPRIHLSRGGLQEVRPVLGAGVLLVLVVFLFEDDGGGPSGARPHLARGEPAAHQEGGFDQAQHQVHGGEGHQHIGRMRPGGDDRAGHPHEHQDERGLLGEAQVLEGAVPHGGDHQQGQRHHRRRHRSLHRGAHLAPPDHMVRDDQRHEPARGQRDGQAHEEAASPAVGIARGDHIEARQPQRPAGGEGEGDEQAQEAQGGQRPLVHQQGRRGTEGHHVRQAVELHAEVALRLRQPGDTSITPVEEHGEEDRQCGLIEVHGGGFSRAQGDGVEATKDGGNGEEVRQNEHQLPQLHRVLAFLMPVHGGMNGP